MCFRRLLLYFSLTKKSPRSWAVPSETTPHSLFLGTLWITHTTSYLYITAQAQAAQISSRVLYGQRYARRSSNRCEVCTYMLAEVDEQQPVSGNTRARLHIYATSEALPYCTAKTKGKNSAGANTVKSRQTLQNATIWYRSSSPHSLHHHRSRLKQIRHLCITICGTQKPAVSSRFYTPRVLENIGTSTRSSWECSLACANSA